MEHYPASHGPISHCHNSHRLLGHSVGHSPPPCPAQGHMKFSERLTAIEWALRSDSEVGGATGRGDLKARTAKKLRWP
ncbi:MAG: hypothetical protein P0S96_05865 [Simkaniaceae bacterium]|nr:hypothetical protein [Candidatus Sacchlamyda saccharinae]